MYGFTPEGARTGALWKLVPEVHPDFGFEVEDGQRG
jgi:hypothetical protein